MWQRSCVNWIPFIATPKERNKKWRAKWPTLKFKIGMNVSCVPEVQKKTEARASLGMQFVGPASCLICKFQSARNRYKRSIVGRGIWLVTSLQNRANQCINVASKSERKKQRNGTGGEQSARKRKRQRNRTGGEQLKDFIFVLRIVTWSYNCLLRIIINSYLKPYICLQIIGIW